jgi:5-methylcytosine-specific restriction endonuclease McrA
VNAAAANFPALVLNADFRPLSYFPLSLWSWQDSIKAVFLDRVNIVSEYDHAVRSPSIEIRLPSVIALKDYVRLDRRPAFTRFNVFLRDSFQCQYCGGGFASEELTFDHLVPRSRGGRTLWTNVVTACQSCNLVKGNRLPAESGGAADHLSVAGKRPRLSAQLPARKLARFPVLGFRAGILILNFRVDISRLFASDCPTGCQRPVGWDTFVRFIVQIH